MGTWEQPEVGIIDDSFAAFGKGLEQLTAGVAAGLMQRNKNKQARLKAAKGNDNAWKKAREIDKLRQKYGEIGGMPNKFIDDKWIAHTKKKLDKLDLLPYNSDEYIKLRGIIETDTKLSTTSMGLLTKGNSKYQGMYEAPDDQGVSQFKDGAVDGALLIIEKDMEYVQLQYDWDINNAENCEFDDDAQGFTYLKYTNPNDNNETVLNFAKFPNEFSKGNNMFNVMERDITKKKSDKIGKTFKGIYKEAGSTTTLKETY